MWKICTILTLVALAGCSTQRAVRVRCDAHLSPINVSGTTVGDRQPPGKSHSIGGGRQ